MVNKVFYIQDSFSLILKCVIVLEINCGNKKKNQKLLTGKQRSLKTSTFSKAEPIEPWQPVPTLAGKKSKLCGQENLAERGSDASLAT